MYIYPDGDGVVDTKELADAIRKMLKGNHSEEESEALAVLLDRDGDGRGKGGTVLSSWILTSILTLRFPSTSSLSSPSRV